MSNRIYKINMKSLVKALSKKLLCNDTFARLIYYTINITFVVINIIVFNLIPSERSQYIKDIKENWSNGFIFDIYEASYCLDKENNSLNLCCDKYKNSNSSDDLIIEDFLFTYNWEGIPSGCDCSNSFIFNKVTSERCSLFDLFTFCEIILPTSPKKLNNWRGKYLCAAKRNFNFVSIDVATFIKQYANKNLTCCGYDTANNILCIDKGTCPINKIVIENKIDLSMESIKLYNGFSIFYSNQPLSNLTNKNSLIADLKYSEGRLCIDPSEQNIKSSLVDEKESIISFYNCKNKLSFLNRDLRYNKLDCQSKSKFYQENFISSYLNKLVDKKKISDQSSNIYYRSFISWSSNCSMSKDNFLKSLNELLNAKYLFIFIPIICLLITITLLLELSIKGLELIFILIVIFIIYLFSNLIDFILLLENITCSDIETNILFNQIGLELIKLIPLYISVLLLKEVALIYLLLY